MITKPPLILQTTTLWNYPSQHYGEKMQGDKNYAGATPSYIIWNLLKRYTNENDKVVDPMCGSGTTIDVCKDLNRRCIGFDIYPYRSDIIKADARELPLKDNTVDFVFIDPPYADNIKYSNEKQCIGRYKANDNNYYESMEQVIKEIHRVLKANRFLGFYICDYFDKKIGFVPIGFYMFSILQKYFKAIDIIAVVRHNKSLKYGNYHKAAIEGNYYLRGFNYLFIMQK